MNIEKLSTRLYSKYCARLAHALKRICELTPPNDEKIKTLIKKIVKIIDENSFHDNKNEYVYYSIGKMSVQKRKKNIQTSISKQYLTEKKHFTYHQCIVKSTMLSIYFKLFLSILKNLKAFCYGKNN